MFDETFKFLIEIAKSAKVQLGLVIAFGIIVLISYIKGEQPNLFILVCFLFAAAMLIINGLEVISIFWRNRKEKKAKLLYDKLGVMENYQYTNKVQGFWLDEKYAGIGWQILVNDASKIAFLTDPCCSKCKTNLIHKVNKTLDGFYLECPQCSTQFEVGDIGERRAIANARMQGDVRSHPDRYFQW